MHTRKLLVALAGFYLLLLVFAWWVYFNSANTLPLWIPCLASIAPPLIALLFWLWQRRAAGRAAGKLEDALAADGSRAQQAAQHGRSAEIDRLRNEFDRAVKALKASKLAHGSRRANDALYRLPWYAIIGPPASGKTTVLRNSGIKFPYLPGTGDRLKGIGGTRNCDWWLTSHAILLDTAGRWSIQEEEREEWLAFLDLLKKHRGERPLNGVIAAISIAGDDSTSISGADETELKEIALRMRERLDEITGRLGVALPVYLLFTKCDLIPGFVESFETMSGDQRRQIWGFTAPALQGARRDPGVYVGQQLDLLRDELERHALVRLSDEVNPRQLPRIYEFPAQFAALKDRLTGFVDELFDQSAYRETPLLRGAYFTSGTQEGAPSDLLYQDLADALKLRPDPSETRSEQKGYFLHDMLMRVVFEDRALAVATEVEATRLHWRKRMTTSAVFASAAVLSLLSTDACRRNLHAIDATRGVFSQAEHERARPDQGPPTRPQHAAELFALEDDLAAYEQTSRSLADLGLDQTERVAPARARYYVNALSEWLVGPLLNANQAALLTRTQQLQASADAPHASDLDDEARSELRDALSLHLLLSAPRERCTPTLLARRDFIAHRLLALWERGSTQAQPDASEQARRKRLLERYLELSSRTAPDVVFPRAERAVAQARRALGEDDLVERRLQRVVASHAGDSRSFVQLAGPGNVIQSQAKVSGAFRREVWTRINRELDASDFREPEGDWVFGCENAQTDEARAQLQSGLFLQRYLQRYEASWRAFLAGLTARPPNSLTEAESMLSELVSRPGVLGGLVKSLQENTALPAAASVADAGNNLKALADIPSVKRLTDNEAAKALGQTAQAALTSRPSDAARDQLSRAFADFTSFDNAAAGGGSPLEQYRQQLDGVLAALRAYREDETKLEPLASAALAALEASERLVRAHGGSWNAQLRGLLLPVLAGIAQLTVRARGDHLARAFCDSVYAPYRQDLAGRFPLKPDSADAASLVAFSRFFQPEGGAVSGFVNGPLAGYVAATGGGYRFTGTHARSLLRDELLTFLQRAAAVTKAFFPDGATGLRVPFRIRVRGAPGYSLTTFRAGTRAVNYDSGQERWTPLEWPGSEPTRGVGLSVTPYQGVGPKPLSVENTWGLFMILQPRFGAQVLERTPRQLTVGWRPRGDQHFVKVDFAHDDPRSALAAIPFGRGGIFPFSVPSRISQAGGPCRENGSQP